MGGSSVLLSSGVVFSSVSCAELANGGAFAREKGFRKEPRTPKCAWCRVRGVGEASECKRKGTRVRAGVAGEKAITKAKFHQSNQLHWTGPWPEGRHAKSAKGRSQEKGGVSVVKVPLALAREKLETDRP